MAKLLQQVFALWKKDCDFDPQFETRLHFAQRDEILRHPKTTRYFHERF